MRDIKFRAWDGEDMLTNLDSINLEAVRCSAIESPDGKSVICCEYMQYTGLKDKNGVDIYEGDIVLTRGVRHCEVIFHKFAGCWDLNLINALSSESIGAVSPASYQYHVEVIGNIHQHKHLLEKSK